MPKYVYFCEVCEEVFEVFHGMKESHDTCDLCSEKGFVYRVPQRTAVFQKTAVGSKVKESIEENKKILKEMKKESRKMKNE